MSGAYTQLKCHALGSMEQGSARQHVEIARNKVETC